MESEYVHSRKEEINKRRKEEIERRRKKGEKNNTRIKDDGIFCERKMESTFSPRGPLLTLKQMIET